MEDTRNEQTTIYKLTKYERARVLGTRSTQISYDAPVLIDTKGETDPYKIAEMELKAKKIPLKLRRYLPGGTYEDLDVNKLI